MRYFYRFILLCVFAISIMPVSARVLILDNNPYPYPTNFHTGQVAHDSASSGDTIYVIGSLSSYGRVYSTKRLTWIGSGYFLAQNNITTANQNATTFEPNESFFMNSGSRGSSLIGLTLGTVYCNTDSILIYRCYFPQKWIRFVNVSYGQVKQCYMTQIVNYDPTIDCQNSNNIIITNNFLYASNSGTASIISASTGARNILITNNVIYNTVAASNPPTLNLNYATVSNNILMQGNIGGSYTIYDHNFTNSTQLDTSNNNRPNTSMTGMFVTSTSPDGQYQLSAGSVARNAGSDGTDCGMYGGVTPYVVSGVPGIPNVTFFQAPATGTVNSGLPIHFRASGRR